MNHFDTAYHTCAIKVSTCFASAVFHSMLCGRLQAQVLAESLQHPKATNCTVADDLIATRQELVRPSLYIPAVPVLVRHKSCVSLTYVLQ